jgi:hypothetical protein
MVTASATTHSRAANAGTNTSSDRTSITSIAFALLGDTDRQAFMGQFVEQAFIASGAQAPKTTTYRRR